MLFPRFTLRTILAVTTAAAVLFLLVGMGYRGQAWAWAAAIGVLSLGLTLLVHAACYGVVWCFAQLTNARAIVKLRSDDIVPAQQEVTS